MTTLPRTVWMLGLTSLFMDVSSELVQSVMPLFLVVGLGASPLMVGAIDGVAEATASALKVFSGAISDWVGKRKPLALLGYGLAAATRPFLPMVGAVSEVFALRFIDRIGKGIRVAPRDALIADHIAPENRGAAYGLRQGLDTVGALAGPLLAAVVLTFSGGDYLLVFWVACIPAVLCVATLALGVREPAHHAQERRPFPLRPSEVRRLGSAFWVVMAAILVLLLPRFSEAFLLLRGNDLGLPAAAVPLVLATMNLVAAPVSYPAGRLSDRIGRRGLILAGFAVLALAHVVLAAGFGWLGVFAGAALWGLHLGLTQGVLAAYVVDSAPAELRGTAFGIYHLASGVAVLAGSLAAGWLWEAIGPAAMFATAAATGALGMAAVMARR